MTILESDLKAFLLLEAPRVLPDLRLFVRTVAAGKIDGRFVRLNVKGQCDLWGVWRGGQHLELELKTATGVSRPEQLTWRAFCEAWGVPYLLLRARRDETIEATVTRWLDEIRRSP